MNIADQWQSISQRCADQRADAMEKVLADVVARFGGIDEALACGVRLIDEWRADGSRFCVMVGSDQVTPWYASRVVERNGGTFFVTEPAADE